MVSNIINTILIIMVFCLFLIFLSKSALTIKFLIGFKPFFKMAQIDTNKSLTGTKITTYTKQQ